MMNKFRTVQLKIVTPPKKIKIVKASEFLKYYDLYKTLAEVPDVARGIKKIYIYIYILFKEL